MVSVGANELFVLALIALAVCVRVGGGDVGHEEMGIEEGDSGEGRWGSREKGGRSGDVSGGIGDIKEVAQEWKVGQEGEVGEGR